MKRMNNSVMNNSIYETRQVICRKCGMDIECTFECEYPYELYPDEISEDNIEMRIVGNPKCTCGHIQTIEELEKFIDG